MNNVMNAKDAVSASLAECFVTMEGNWFCNLPLQHFHLQGIDASL